MAIEPSGEMVYTTSSETARKRFISDYYGLKIPLGAWMQRTEHALGYHSQGDVRRQI